MSYLKDKLEEKHMTQIELAKRLGVTKGWISQLANDDSRLFGLPFDTLYEISVILDIPIEIFIKNLLITSITIEEIDIMELLKRIKEGRPPKKILITGNKYLYNENNEECEFLYYLYKADCDASGDKQYWLDNERIELTLDTKIGILKY